MGLDGDPYTTPTGFAKAARRRGVAVDDLASQTVLRAPEILVSPRGSNGGQRRGQRLKADDGEAFRGLELLWKLHELQAPHLSEPTEGTGLYRLGFARGLPSYYILGDRDAAGFAP